MTKSEAKLLTYMANSGFKVYLDMGFTDEIVSLQYSKKDDEYLCYMSNPSYSDSKMRDLDVSRFTVSRKIDTVCIKELAKELPSALKEDNVGNYIADKHLDFRCGRGWKQ